MNGSQEKRRERFSDLVGTKVAKEDDLNKEIRIDPRAMRVCCGRAIVPSLAEIQEYAEPTLFVSVWRCPHCGRVSS